MDNNSKFRYQLFGFNKNDVSEFIETLYKSIDDKFKEKSDETIQLNKQNELLKDQIKDLNDKLSGVDDYKSNIADVLLRAKDHAQVIINEAIKQSEDIKKETNKYIETEKIKLEEFRNDIKNLKHNTADLLVKYNKDIEKIMEQLPSE